MKKIILLLSLATILITSCKQNEYQLYDTDSSNHISFVEDTIDFDYGFFADLDAEVETEVTIIGMPPMSDEDIWEIGITYGEETNATEGVEFDIVKVIQNGTSDVIKVDIHKDALEYNKEYVLVLDITDNEYFSPTGLSRCYIRFSNKDLERPVWWNDTKLGAFTVEKYVMFINIFWSTKELSPVYYNVMFKRHGENLTEPYKPYSTDMLPLMLNFYTVYWLKYFYAPMYAYYLETGDPNYEMPEYYY